jgi:hypothetical protein
LKRDVHRHKVDDHTRKGKILDAEIGACDDKENSTKEVAELLPRTAVRHECVTEVWASGGETILNA